MTFRRKRSKKQSGASSTAAKRLERTVFYLDESIYSRFSTIASARGSSEQA
jgi:hypothetical protein